MTHTNSVAACPTFGSARLVNMAGKSMRDRYRYECVIDGCRHTPYSSGFCYRHYQRYVVEDRTR